MKISETKICEIIAKHFSHADIYPEVPCGGGVIDLVILDKPLVIAIEAKTSLSMSVMEQAFERLGYANYVYIATPSSPSNMQKKFLSHFGIGCYKVSDVYGGGIHEMIKPKMFRKIASLKLEDWMKKSIAGSQHERQTPFGHFVQDLKSVLSGKPNGLTYKEAFEATYKYYLKETSFKSNVYQYINRGVIKGIEVEKGILKLTTE